MAQQVVLGEVPIRDFYDPGWPMMYLLSAAAWMIAGNSMAIEFALTAAAFAAAAACTVVVAYRLSGSLGIAMLVTVLEILVYPRSYAYPKLLVYAMAAWAIVAASAQPSARRLWVMAAIVAVSFLFRHDHGAYVGLAAMFVVVVSNFGRGWPIMRRQVGELMAAVAIFLLPWATFIALNGGLVAYVAGGLEFARAEAAASMLRTWPPLFTLPPGGPRTVAMYAAALNADAWLFWIYWMLPLLCGVLVYRRMRAGNERWSGELTAVRAVILLAVLVNAGFLRDVLRTRVPDAVVPAVLLGAWALGLCWMRRWRYLTAQVIVGIAAIGVLGVTAHAVARIGSVRERVSDTGIATGVDGVRGRAAFLSTVLRQSHRQAAFPPSRFSQALVPFFGYLDRCTLRDDRLIVTGEFPDLLVLAGRGFAGDGVVFGAWYSSVVHEDRSIAHVAARSAPFALLVGDASDFRLLHAHLAEHYEPMTAIPVEGAEDVRVLVQRDRGATRIDPETGWPCFR